MKPLLYILCKWKWLYLSLTALKKGWSVKGRMKIHLTVDITNLGMENNFLRYSKCLKSGRPKTRRLGIQISDIISCHFGKLASLDRFRSKKLWLYNPKWPSLAFGFFDQKVRFKMNKNVSEYEPSFRSEIGVFGMLNVFGIQHSTMVCISDTYCTRNRI